MGANLIFYEVCMFVCVRVCVWWRRRRRARAGTALAGALNPPSLNTSASKTRRPQPAAQPLSLPKHTRVHVENIPTHPPTRCRAPPPPKKLPPPGGFNPQFIPSIASVQALFSRSFTSASFLLHAAFINLFSARVIYNQGAFGYKRPRCWGNARCALWPFDKRVFCGCARATAATRRASAAPPAPRAPGARPRAHRHALRRRSAAGMSTRLPVAHSVLLAAFAGPLGLLSHALTQVGGGRARAHTGARYWGARAGMGGGARAAGGRAGRGGWCGALAGMRLRRQMRPHARH